jgi:hypothetical protein
LSRVSESVTRRVLMSKDSRQSILVRSPKKMVNEFNLKIYNQRRSGIKGNLMEDDEDAFNSGDR